MALADALIIALSLTTMVTDSRWRRIPNWLTFPAMGLGLFINALEGGWDGLWRGIGGLFLALSFTIPLFALGFVKAGDVKLIAAFGSIKGIGAPPTQSFALWAFLYGALVGGLWALATLVQARSLGVAWARMRGMLTSFVVGGTPRMPAVSEGNEENDLRQPMPYGVALSLGALMALACEWFWGQPFPLLSG